MDKQTSFILITIVGISLVYGASAHFLSNLLSDKKTNIIQSKINVTTTPTPTPIPTPILSSEPTVTPVNSGSRMQTTPPFIRSDDDIDK